MVNFKFIKNSALLFQLFLRWNFFQQVFSTLSHFFSMQTTHKSIKIRCLIANDINYVNKLLFPPFFNIKFEIYSRQHKSNSSQPLQNLCSVKLSQIPRIPALKPPNHTTTMMINAWEIRVIGMRVQGVLQKWNEFAMKKKFIAP